MEKIVFDSFNPEPFKHFVPEPINTKNTYLIIGLIVIVAFACGIYWLTTKGEKKLQDK
jgi:hypothetical protein